MSTDYKDTTISAKADVPLPLKSAALPKSEETLHFCPSPYTFERNAYFKASTEPYTSAISKECFDFFFFFSKRLRQNPN